MPYLRSLKVSAARTYSSTSSAASASENKYSRRYISRIGLLGHSQGGVVASMTAGTLASRGESPAALVLIAPGSVVQDACRNGKFFGAKFNPTDSSLLN